MPPWYGFSRAVAQQAEHRLKEPAGYEFKSRPPTNNTEGSAMFANIKPGDILAVRSTSAAAEAIRFGAAVKELFTREPEPNLDNHIAFVHHIDANGTVWCLEGRPGGVGWRDASDYLKSPWTISNVRQPKTPRQRSIVCAEAPKLVGTEYDWEAIEDDALQSFGLHLPGWHPQFGAVPGHIVCSSYAAYLYAKAGLTHPQGGRNVTPADWVALILENHWEG
jgi:hypothetical protein